MIKVCSSAIFAFPSSVFVCVAGVFDYSLLLYLRTVKCLVAVCVRWANIICLCTTVRRRWNDKWANALRNTIWYARLPSMLGDIGNGKRGLILKSTENYFISAFHSIFFPFRAAGIPARLLSSVSECSMYLELVHLSVKTYTRSDEQIKIRWWFIRFLRFSLLLLLRRLFIYYFCLLDIFAGHPFPFECVFFPFEMVIAALKCCFLIIHLCCAHRLGLGRRGHVASRATSQREKWWI